jgi:hypothetical protein
VIPFNITRFNKEELLSVVGVASGYPWVPQDVGFFSRIMGASAAFLDEVGVLLPAKAG